jgi:hypothetical protein
MSFPQEWTIQSQCQDCVHKAHTKHTQAQRNTESQSDEQHGSHQNSLVNPGAREGQAGPVCYNIITMLLK